MQRIETKAYRTPPTRGDDEWSVGVLHLTRDETEMVAQFARSLQQLRGSDRDTLTVTIPKNRSLFPRSAIVTDTTSASKSAGDNDSDQVVPGNRFSGLDIR